MIRKLIAFWAVCLFLCAPGLALAQPPAYTTMADGTVTRNQPVLGWNPVTLTWCVIGSSAACMSSPTGGTTGLDFSANKPAIPAVGAAFASGSLYASYVLIATVPASATRASIDIEDDSGAQIVVVRDDGTAASGAAPTNASVFSLSGGSGVGSQGGSWTSTTFKGRLQVYAPAASAQVAILVE